jgi:hypothetical protein
MIYFKRFAAVLLVGLSLVAAVILYPFIGLAYLCTGEDYSGKISKFFRK